MAHMIEEGKDSMVYLAGTEPPWHDLGVTIPPNLSSIEAMDHANLGWGVRGVPIFTVGNVDVDESEDSYYEVSGFKALERQDNRDILDIVSDSYSIYQNAEAFGLFQQVLATGLVRINTAGSLKAGRVVWVLGEIVHGGEEDVANGDKVKKYVLFSWGHMKGRSVQLGYTTTRVVCWNTLNAAEAHGELIRVLHRGDLKRNVEAISKSLEVATASFKADVETYRQMMNTTINADDLRKYVKVALSLVPANGNIHDEPSSTRAKNILNRVTSLAELGIGNKGHGNTLWGAFNAVTQYVSHEAGRNKDNRLFNQWWGSGKTAQNTALDLAKQLMVA